MKAVSGIVATAILLSLTIAGGVLLYTYITRYLNAAIESGNLVVERAYYIKALQRLDVEVRNIGTGDVEVNGVEIISSNKSTVINKTLIMHPGSSITISIENVTETPIYVIVKYGKGSTTEPVSVKTI